MPISDDDRIDVKQILPAGAERSLSKNGVDRTLDEHIDHAYSRNGERWRLAAAAMLDVIAADTLFLSEGGLGVSRGKPLLEERAARLRSDDEADRGEDSTWSTVPIHRTGLGL